MRKNLLLLGSVFCLVLISILNTETLFAYDQRDYEKITSDEGELSSLNLEDAGFSEVVIGEKRLVDINFKNVTFDNVYLKQLTIEDSDFEEAVFLGKKNVYEPRVGWRMVSPGRLLDHLNLKNSSLKKVKISDISFLDCNFEDLDCEGLVLDNVIFRRCNFMNVNMRDLNAQSVTFDDCSLENVSFRSARLNSFRMENMGCFGENLNFRHVSFDQCFFVGKRLSNLSLGKQDLRTEGLEFLDEDSKLKAFFTKPFRLMKHLFNSYSQVNINSFFKDSNFSNISFVKNTYFGSMVFLDCTGLEELHISSFGRTIFDNVDFVFTKDDNNPDKKEVLEHLVEAGGIINGEYSDDYRKLGPFISRFG